MINFYPENLIEVHPAVSCFSVLSFLGLYTCFIDGRSVALRNGINKFVMEISSNKTDRVYAMQELPSIYFIDRSLYMGYYGHHSDRNSSLSKRVIITSIFASLLKLSLDVAFDFAIADTAASFPPPPDPNSDRPFPQPDHHPTGPTLKSSRWSGLRPSRRVLSISMSSLAGFRGRHLDTTSSTSSPSPSSTNTNAPSVVKARRVGDIERGVTADSDCESGEGSKRRGQNVTPSEKYDNVHGGYTGEALPRSACIDTADMPRRAAVVSSAPSTSFTVRSVLPNTPSLSAAPGPLLFLTDVSRASSKQLSPPARRLLVFFSAVGAGVLGVRLLGHPSSLLVKVLGVVVGCVRHIAQKTIGRDLGEVTHGKENDRQSDGQHQQQAVRFTGKRKSFKF